MATQLTLKEVLGKAIQIEKAAYDVIVCFNYLQRSLIPQIKDGL